MEVVRPHPSDGELGRLRPFSSAGTRDGVPLISVLPDTRPVTSELIHQIQVGLEEVDAFLAGNRAGYKVDLPAKVKAKGAGSPAC